MSAKAGVCLNKTTEGKSYPTMFLVDIVWEFAAGGPAMKHNK